MPEVTDTKTCAKAAQAIATVVGGSATNRAIYLVKVNTSYVAKDPTVEINGSWLSLVLDGKFAVLKRFTG